MTMWLGREHPRRLVSMFVASVLTVAVAGGLITLAISQLTHRPWHPDRLVSMVPVIALLTFTLGDSDRAAFVEPGWLTERRRKKRTRIPASEVTGITVQRTPGLLSRTVHLRVEMGRFRELELPDVKARNTPAGRAHLQHLADRAMDILRSEDARP